MKNNISIRRWATWLLVPSLAIALAACDQQPERREFPPPTVSTLKLVPKDTEITTELPGRVNALKDAQVLARVTGNIESIEFEQGSHVKKGDVLFKIDPKPYQALVNEAKANVAQMQATARSANALFKRYSGLVNSAAISKQEYDDARAAAGKANADIKAAQAALETAQINLGYTKVESPIDGIIGRAIVTEGALVSNNPPTELALVQQLDEVYVDFNQSTSDLAKIRKSIADGELTTLDGQSPPVEVITSDGDVYPEKGKLMFTGVTVDQATGQVQLRSIFPNKDHILLPGMYVTVRIPIGRVRDALTVPIQALMITTTGEYEVYVVDSNNIARKVTVKVGSKIGSDRVVLSGLKAGDLVVTEGTDRIVSGKPVQPKAWVTDKYRLENLGGEKEDDPEYKAKLDQKDPTKGAESASPPEDTRSGHDSTNQ